VLHIEWLIFYYSVKYFQWLELDTRGVTPTTQRYKKYGTNGYKTIHFGLVTISTIILTSLYAKIGNKRPGTIFKMTLNVLKWSELPPPTVLFPSR
jgi:hypothetical protein